MYLTVGDFKKIEKALRLLPKGDAFCSLSDEDKQAILDADAVLVAMLKKRKAANEKTWRYIKKRRETDPSYARPAREYKRK